MSHTSSLQLELEDLRAFQEEAARLRVHMPEMANLQGAMERVDVWQVGAVCFVFLHMFAVWRLGHGAPCRAMERVDVWQVGAPCLDHFDVQSLCQFHDAVPPACRQMQRAFA